MEKYTHIKEILSLHTKVLELSYLHIYFTIISIQNDVIDSRFEWGYNPRNHVKLACYLNEFRSWLSDRKTEKQI